MPRSARLQITQRDKELLRRAEAPATKEDLADLFSCDEAYYRRMKQLLDAKHILRVGAVPNELGTGRLVDVFCVERCKPDNLLHELRMARLLRKWKISFVRGNQNVDPDLLPDATLEDAVHIELDMGSMSHRRVLQRLRNYESISAPVVFVTSARSRMWRVLQSAEFLAGRILGCLYEEALRPADEVILADADGDSITLEELLGIALGKAPVS